jgi:endonuclease/exonuclease/phosphatase family metal-dependent hydrolase
LENAASRSLAPEASKSWLRKQSRRPHKKAEDYRTMLAREPRPLLLCGDFNAIPPEDGPDRTELEKAFAAFAADPAFSVARFVDGGKAVFVELAEAGMRDAIPREARSRTMPTRLIFADLASAMRLDHVLASEDVSILDGKIETGNDAERASDHLPVWVDVEIPSCLEDA